MYLNKKGISDISKDDIPGLRVSMLEGPNRGENFVFTAAKFFYQRNISNTRQGKGREYLELYRLMHVAFRATGTPLHCTIFTSRSPSSGV